MLEVGTFSDDFLVQVGLQKGSVLSPLLFIIVLDTLSNKFVGDMALVSETPEGLKWTLEV